jgi:hypothetical protein
MTLPFWVNLWISISAVQTFQCVWCRIDSSLALSAFRRRYGGTSSALNPFPFASPLKERHRDNIILREGLHNNKISIRGHVLAVTIRSGLSRRTPCNPCIRDGAVVEGPGLGIAVSNALEIKGENGQLVGCRICCECHRTAVGDIQISF